MADKKAQRLFLRLISETFFVSDDTLDSKKIDRLVKRLDRLDPIPSSASSAEEALQHWYHTQGIEPPSVELERPRFCSAKKRGKHIWKTIVAPAASLWPLFIVIWVHTNFHESSNHRRTAHCRIGRRRENKMPRHSSTMKSDLITHSRRNPNWRQGSRRMRSRQVNIAAPWSTRVYSIPWICPCQWGNG